jgi:hypothetical protein
MVIFFLIKRTVWDRYLQVAIVKLDAINAAFHFTSFHFTGMAQGQRAGLITPRSLDRNGLPVKKSYKHVLFILFTLLNIMDEGKRIEQMKAVQAEALELFMRKNADYGDAFATYGVIGVLMRIEDKIQRSMSITKTGVNLVSDEGIRDTLIDLHNYAAMALMLLDE